MAENYLSRDVQLIWLTIVLITQIEQDGRNFCEIAKIDTKRSDCKHNTMHLTNMAMHIANLYNSNRCYWCHRKIKKVCP